MKPFNIKLAKQNHPVQTRDGRPARIVCWDRHNALFPIVALINEDFTHYYSNDGVAINNKSDLDLVMAPTKKEGWVNVYKSSTGSVYTEQERVYDSEKEAIEGKCSRTCNRVYITSKKIDLEE